MHFAPAQFLDIKLLRIGESQRILCFKRKKRLYLQLFLTFLLLHQFKNQFHFRSMLFKKIRNL